jgi:hypothetical protein
MHDDYDRSSKWLFQHQGLALLRAGGVRGEVRAWRAVAPEVVQPRQVPDGLLEVQFADRKTVDLFLAEIATYPEARVLRQMMRDTLLVFLDREVLPEVVVFVLKPRGPTRVADEQEIESRLGWTKLGIKWRVVEVWKLKAEELFAANEVGVLPLVPLTQFDGPPEPVLRHCRRRIDDLAPEKQRANYLAVSQVLTRLRYNDAELLAIFGGSQAMIESPLIDEIVLKAQHEARQKDILKFLAGRFDSVPPDVENALLTIKDDAHLESLVEWAGACPDLKSFQVRLKSKKAPKRGRRR